MWSTRTAADARFSSFVAEAQPHLSQAAYLLTGSRATAEDLLQDALVRTYLAWHRVEPGKERAWVRRVMTNLVIDRWRRRRYEPVLGDESDRHRSTSRDGYDTVDHRDDIARQLAGLKPIQRAVIVLRYYEDLSEAEVAGELGLPVGTVKSTCSRALQRLRSVAESTATGA